MNRYPNFQELNRREREGEDYAILLRQGRTSITVMAIHGGGIEPGTEKIADGVASNDHTFYAFKGLKASGNALLHLPSHVFDEPRGVEAASSADVVLAVHGLRGSEEKACIGGRHTPLKKKIKDTLINAGFAAEEAEKQGLKGQHPTNICNRCRSGQGLQIEISAGLRKKMFHNPGGCEWNQETEHFFRFVEALREALR